MARGSVYLRLLPYALSWHLAGAESNVNALAEVTTCPKGWYAVKGRCFWMSATEHTFESCQQDVCGIHGATLACIHADDSYALAYQFNIGYSDDLFAAWIGFTNAGGKEWEWINGCKMSWTNWVTGEPNDFCGGESCAAINGVSGGWMDLSCRLRFPCLCEYPSTLIPTYNLSVVGMRDNTCYSGCGGVTKWCSAWPFLRLYDVDDDVCHWEHKDGQRRGKGVTECAKRVAEHPDCSPYFSYSVGVCGCAPSRGKHVNCTHRAKDATSDVFFVSKGGNATELISSAQRCVYTHTIDDEFFMSLRPAYSSDLLKVWARVAFIWLAFGLPSFAMMFFVLSRVCCRCSDFSQFQDDDPFKQDGDEVPSSGGEASYGPLIDGTDPAVADAVNRWLVRGAFGIICYGMALGGLGITLGVHISGSAAGASLQALELMCALVMAVSKFSVTRASFMVHCRLSPVARRIAGPWVLVYAMTRFGGAISALGTVLVFGSLAQRDYDMICFSIYLFRWSLLLALPLEGVAGFAVWRAQVRAEPYAGGEARVGGWVTSLVTGSFGAGAAVWWAGYLGAVHEADMAMGGCFILAALSQLVAGVSMLLINRKIKQHFCQPTQVQAGVGTVAPTELGKRPGDVEI